VTTLVEQTASAIDDVMTVHDVAVRWVGHRQRVELHIIVDCQMTTLASHTIAEAVRHELFHALPALADATVHVDPCECDRSVNYHPTRHHTSFGIEPE
jgi:divalent metal cation (Fe/Co/Zn/Cd) transporter